MRRRVFWCRRCHERERNSRQTPGARLAAATDKAKAMSALKKGDIAVVERNGNMVVPPDAAFGATLIFETSKAG
jgi:hypothetical protein